MTQIKWETVTREERYFTCVLFHDMVQNIEPLRLLLLDRLRLPLSAAVSDIGYEVCFFRDAYRSAPKLIRDRKPKLEKQTFDLVLWLSDQSMIIIEAKAQQGFHIDQLRMLWESEKLIRNLSTMPIPKIFLVGLCSSRYALKEKTFRQLDAVIRWGDIARIYPARDAHTDVYMRADSLYRK